MTAAGVFYPPGADTRRGTAPVLREPVPARRGRRHVLRAARTRAWRSCGVERTPPDFTFDIKAHALLTGQPSETKRLPKDIRTALPDDLAAKARLYARDLPRELSDELFRLFREGLEPLRRERPAGLDPAPVPALGLPLVGEPRRDPRGEGAAGGCRCRSSSATAAGSTRRTRSGRCGSCRTTQIPLVVVDGPQGFKSSLPLVVAATSPDLAVVRFHGRRTATWEAKGIPTVERFRYLYDASELEEWAPRIARAGHGRRARRTCS